MPFVKQLRKIGNSTGIVLDQAILRQVDLEPTDQVEVSVKDGSIVLTPHRYATEEDFSRAAADVFKTRRRLMERLAK